jgi:signal peptidase
MASRWIRRAAGLVLPLAAVAALWWFLAPPQVGGRTAWAVVDGNSMAPGLASGDLVLVRARSSYDVDDVVLFASETLGGAHVLHRIVGAESGRFVTRGDNRTQVDPDSLTADAIVGRLWLTIPGVGAALAWIGRPLPLAILLFLLVFLALAGGRERSRRRPSRAVHPLHAVVTPAPAGGGEVRVGALARPLVAAGLVATCLFGALALLSWSRPATEQVTVEGAYAHSGDFAYGADVRSSAVYPDGRVETGQAVFRAVVDRVRFAFDYRFTSTESASLRGGIGLEAVVSDGEGWSRSILLAPSRPFEGASAHIEGMLDLRRLEASVTRMRSLTRTAPTTFQVAVTPLVQVAGYSGSTVIDASFEPALPFTYDGLAVRPTQGDDGRLPLSPTVEGDATRVVDTTIGVETLSLTTSDARAFAAVGLVVGLLLAACAGLVLARQQSADAAAVLHSRYGSRLVAARVVVPEGRWISDVDDAESLGVIAEHYDRVILHSSEPGGDVYLVDDGVAVYRYRASRAPLPATTVSPAAGT